MFSNWFHFFCSSIELKEAMIKAEFGDGSEYQNEQLVSHCAVVPEGGMMVCVNYQSSDKLDMVSHCHVIKGNLQNLIKIVNDIEDSFYAG